LRIAGFIFKQVVIIIIINIVLNINSFSVLSLATVLDQNIVFVVYYLLNICDKIHSDNDKLIRYFLYNYSIPITGLFQL